MNTEEKELIELMIQSGQDLNEPIDEFGTTPLLIVCHEAELDLVEKLIDRGADVNQANNDGMTPLMAACDAEEDVDNVLEVIALLVEAGADINATSKQGVTALFLAACWDEDDIAQALVDNGASITLAIEGAKTQAKLQPEEAEDFFEVIAELENLRR